MKTRLLGAGLALFLAMSGQALASAVPDDAPNCNSRDWTGTYMSAISFAGIPGKNFVVQWQFHNDGTMTLFATYYLENFVTQGTGSPGRGVWKCTADGKVVASWIDGNFPSNGFDTQLSSHNRWTYRFRIQDRNTLVREALARRIYAADEDPTDPAGGVVSLTSVSERTYRRMRVSEGDLPVTP